MDSLAVDLVAILALVAACLGFGALQLWIARRDPGNPGLRRGCDGLCDGERRQAPGGCASCQNPPRG